MTVCVMCPAMSLWATVLFQRPGIEFVPAWLQTVVCNFPMAFFWQIFFCGPLVRRLFRRWCPLRRLPRPAKKRRNDPGKKRSRTRRVRDRLPHPSGGFSDR